MMATVVLLRRRMMPRMTLSRKIASVAGDRPYWTWETAKTVSYTHLDVYKRQTRNWATTTKPPATGAAA